MKPLVFLGSGVSLPSFEEAKGEGYGTVQSLTTALFDESWSRTTWREWIPADQVPADIFHQPPCREFLSRLRKRTEDYYLDQRGSLINYEDLFSLTDQICDEAGWTDNAAIKPFRVEISELCADLCEPRRYSSHKPFEDLARETLDFIQNVVAAKLRVEVPIKGLDLLKELASLPGVEPLTICTLNHDLLVERLLEGSIDYTNGFLRTATNGIRYFDRAEFLRKHAQVKLLKLHGSIDWWLFPPEGGVVGDDQFGIFAPLPREDCRSKSGKRLDPRKSHPHFLTGTDKLAAYQSGIFLAQMREFERALDEHDLIVMSGYGWSDNGINIRLKSWMWEKQGRQIILLHERPDDLRPRRALQHWFDRMVDENKLILIRKWMRDVDAMELRLLLET